MAMQKMITLHWAMLFFNALLGFGLLYGEDQTLQQTSLYVGSKKNIHVYVLLGQSNMAGRADFPASLPMTNHGFLFSMIKIFLKQHRDL